MNKGSSYRLCVHVYEYADGGLHVHVCMCVQMCVCVCICVSADVCMFMLV